MPIDEDDDEENLFGMKGITNVGWSWKKMAHIGRF
jgi:hypothetical protein